MLRWLLCCFVFLPLWDRLYDNVVLINSLGIPAGEWQRRHQRVAVVSLEGLLSGEQIFSRETKLVVLSRRLLLLWCWMAKLLDGRTLPWVAVKRLILIQPFFWKKERKGSLGAPPWMRGGPLRNVNKKRGKPMMASNSSLVVLRKQSEKVSLC